MSFLKTNLNKLNRFIQGKNDRNRAALIYLQNLGYPIQDIRKALIALNKINVTQLSKRPDVDVTPALIHLVIYGTRENQKAKEILADTLNLRVEEMFPPREMA